MLQKSVLGFLKAKNKKCITDFNQFKRKISLNRVLNSSQTLQENQMIRPQSQKPCRNFLLDTRPPSLQPSATQIPSLTLDTQHLILLVVGLQLLETHCNLPASSGQIPYANSSFVSLASKLESSAGLCDLQTWKICPHSCNGAEYWESKSVALTSWKN